MKKLLVLSLLLVSTFCVATPTVTNQYGSVTLTTAVANEKSELMQYNGILSQIPGNPNGCVAYSTGPLIEGDYENGGVFSGAGSQVTITGYHNVPTGVIFTGTIGDAGLVVTLADGVYTYTLTATISGVLKNGKHATGTLTETFTATPEQLAAGTATQVLGVIYLQ